MQGEDGFVDRVYEAAVVPELWRGVMQTFATMVGAREAGLVAVSPSGFKWTTSSPSCDELATTTYRYPGGIERSQRLIALKRQGFVTDVDVYTDEEMAAEPFYRDYLRPSGYGLGLATAIEITAGEIIIVHAEGDYRNGPFPPDVFRRVDGLRPHLARAAVTAARLAFERARSAVDTLTQLGYAAAAVSGNGVLQIANDAFAAEKDIWTTRFAGRLVLTDKRADPLFQEALTTIGRHLSVRSIPMAGREGRGPAVIHVLPVRGAAHDVFARSAALLILTRPTAGGVLQAGLIQSLFDLTPAEAEIVTAIVGGQTVNEIAAATSRSRETVRHLLKHALAKTGCHRQVDLVRLMAGLDPRA